MPRFTSWNDHNGPGGTTVYFHLIFRSVMVIGLIGSTTANAQDTTRPYTISHTGTLPTDEVISTVTTLMGIEIERFQFEVPGSRILDFTSYTYKNGKEHWKYTGQVKSTASGGQHELMLIKYDTDSINFGVYLGDDVEGLSPISRVDARFTAKHPFALKELVRGKKIPFYVFATDPDRVTEFGGDASEDSIKQYIKENKWVWVGYVEMK